MGEDRSGSESSFQRLEGFMTSVREVPWNTLMSELSEWNNNVGVI